MNNLCGKEFIGQNRHAMKNGNAIAMLPTLTMQEVEHKDLNLTPTGRGMTKAGKDSHSVGLMDRIAMNPTPTTPRPHDNEKTAGKYYPSQNQKDLTYTIAMIPTITANTAKNTSPGINFDKREQKCHLDGVFMNHLGTNTGLMLQPGFAEWMMGFPIGWTALSASEMQYLPTKSIRSSKRLQISKEV
jgi:hypothetical protein